MTGLVCAGSTLAANAFDIPLQRRSFGINVNETNTRAVVSYVDTIMMKYSNALQNYKQNTGKDHPLASKTFEKRDEGSVDLKPAAGGAEWVGPIKVGGQEFLVDFDTGSADLIVNAAAYDPSKSDSSVDTHKQFRASYGDGTNGNGEVYRDSLELGGATADSVSIGRSDKQLADPNKEDGNQGIAGLAFTSISGFRKHDLGAKSIYEAIGKSNSVPHNVYQFTLTTGDGSQLHVGGVDNSKISGDITYVNVDPAYGFWFTHATISGMHVPAVIDSGTTLIMGVRDQVENLLKSIDGVEVVSNNGQIHGVYDCDRDLGITINIGGKDMRISKEAQRMGTVGDRCLLSIIGASYDQPMNAWTVGDTLFRGNSIIFDMERHRLGFATAA